MPTFSAIARIGCMVAAWAISISLGTGDLRMGFADEVNASSFVSTLPRVSRGEACAGWHDEAAPCDGLYRCVVVWVNLVKGREKGRADWGAGTTPRPRPQAVSYTHLTLPTNREV